MGDKSPRSNAKSKKQKTSQKANKQKAVQALTPAEPIAVKRTGTR
jgi:hypothetical protein